MLNSTRKYRCPVRPLSLISPIYSRVVAYVQQEAYGLSSVGKKANTRPENIGRAVISDSKGNYLKKQVVRVEDRAIYWWCQADDNIEKRLRWLRRNMQDKVNEVGSIHFYIWLGICNLTTKDKSVYISLAFTETNDAIAVITNLFKQFTDLVNQYPNCKLTFVEVPHHSVVRWNITRVIVSQKCS